MFSYKAACVYLSQTEYGWCDQHILPLKSLEFSFLCLMETFAQFALPDVAFKIKDQQRFDSM